MYSSTTLEGPSKSGCWKMLDYSEANADSLFPLEYRSYLGQAAHAVMQYCAERRAEKEADIRQTGEEVAKLLISEGRTFRGHHEPPMPADDVYQGVDVAVFYMIGRGLNLDADVLIPERDWDHPSMPYRALIDLVSVQEEGDEEYSQRVLEVTDYKSSWQAGEDELNTLQRWGQAVVMWRRIQDFVSHWPPSQGGLVEADIIRQRVVNLRTWQEWTRDINLTDPDDVAELEKWERRIAALCKTAQETQAANAPTDVPFGTGPRPANPGIGCLSCAYRHVCEDTKETWFSFEGDTAMLAKSLAIVEGQRSMLIAMLKAGDIEKPIPIEGGVVGFKEQVRRVFQAGKERDILDEWMTLTACEISEKDMPVLVSLLTALKLGKGNLDAFSKALMPERRKGIMQDRADYVETLTTEKRIALFGVWPDE